MGRVNCTKVLERSSAHLRWPHGGGELAAEGPMVSRNIGRDYAFFFFIHIATPILKVNGCDPASGALSRQSLGQVSRVDSEGRM
jgi:hypothetical protein